MKYYYHISDKFTESTIELKPRATGDNRDPEEPEISRICVGPSISKCLIAIPYCSMDYHVYRTKHKVKGYRPKVKEVFDSKQTKEVWLKKPTKFVLVGIVKVNGEFPYTPCVSVGAIYTSKKRLDKRYKSAEKKIKKLLKDDMVFIKITKEKVSI